MPLPYYDDSKPPAVVMLEEATTMVTNALPHYEGKCKPHMHSYPHASIINSQWQEQVFATATTPSITSQLQQRGQHCDNKIFAQQSKRTRGTTTLSDEHP